MGNFVPFLPTGPASRTIHIVTIALQLTPRRGLAPSRHTAPSCALHPQQQLHQSAAAATLPPAEHAAAPNPAAAAAATAAAIAAHASAPHQHISCRKQHSKPQAALTSRPHRNRCVEPARHAAPCLAALPVYAA